MEYTQHLVNNLYIERGWKDWKNYIRIWHDNGRITAIAHKEDTCNVFFQTRLGYESLYGEMLQWAEENCAIPEKNNESRHLVIWARESDDKLKSFLKSKDYKQKEYYQSMNVINLNDHYKYEPELPKGFTIRSMDEDIDSCKRFNVINKAFHPADGYKVNVPGSYFKMINAPMYKPELDIVTESKDGTITSACIVWYDDYGIKVTINSDDIIIFDSEVSEEYMRLYEAKVFTAKELNQIRLYGLESRGHFEVGTVHY